MNFDVVDVKNSKTPFKNQIITFKASMVLEAYLHLIYIDNNHKRCLLFSMYIFFHLLCILRVSVKMACCLCLVQTVLGLITEVAHGGFDIPLSELFELVWATFMIRVLLCVCAWVGMIGGRWFSNFHLLSMIKVRYLIVVECIVACKHVWALKGCSIVKRGW